MPQQRHSIRLKHYDYAQPGAYFVTIVTQARARLFGDIVDGEMHLDNAGRMVDEVMLNLQSFYTGIVVDTQIVMPNHIHAIVVIHDHVGAGPVPALGSVDAGQPQGIAPTRPSLGDIVNRLKSTTTHAYIHAMTTHHLPPFETRLWQRNYHEHVIRNESQLNALRQYVTDNPAAWPNDVEPHPL